MPKEFSSWISLKYLFIRAGTNTRNSDHIDEYRLDSDIIDKDFKNVLLNNRLINDKYVKSH